MPEIEITEDQQEYLEDLRAELEADIVGPYGHVRIGDAVQYLIDNHDGTLDDVLAEEAANAAESDDSGDVDENEASEGSDDDGDADTEESGDDDAEESEDDDAEESEDDDADEAEDDDAADDQSGEDRLSAMMSLLDTHDEKWRETSGDARYEVDLPDGTSEDAPTKDDVRALLFKNY
jgi:cobalamin biosynthesis protein CobT